MPGTTRLTVAGLALVAGLQTGGAAVGWPPEEGFFPILPWGPLHGWSEPWTDHDEGLDGIAECGFTLAGFIRPEDLPDCERLGLKGIVFPDVPNVGTWSRQWHQLTDEEIDARIKAFVEFGGESDAIMGYYIQDEPSATHFPGLAKAVAAVKRYAPGKLAYINLYPDYATVGAPDTSQLGTATYEEYLQRFVDEVGPQLISYDNYMTQVSMDMADAARARSYYGNLMAIRQVALDNGLPFWNIVSSNQIRPATTVPSPANLMLQAYTTLAAGGRGVSWYTYYSRSYAYAPIDAEGNRTATWSYLRMVNDQLKVVGPVMNRLTPTGVFFTPGAGVSGTEAGPTVQDPLAGLPGLPGRIVAGVGEDRPVMIGEFTGEDGADYVMAVNLNLRDSLRLLLDTHGEYSVRSVLSPESGAWLPLDSENSTPIDAAFKRSFAPGGEDYRNGLWLAAGQGMLLRFAE